jgi:hypothetical protein
MLSASLFFLTNAMWLHIFLDPDHTDIFSAIGYFLVMVWSVPCGLFISLTCNDYNLPASSEISSPYDQKQKSLIKLTTDYLIAYCWMIPGIGGILQLFFHLRKKKT